jgi:hypothetical protein
MHPIDWNATAAWIALAISITGTIVGPIITTILTNRHQIKLRKLDIYERKYKDFTNRRRTTIENFISYTGQYITNPHREEFKNYSNHFFSIYAYAPESMWPSLDALYEHIAQENDSDAKMQFVEINRVLSAMLKEEPPAKP